MENDLDNLMFNSLAFSPDFKHDRLCFAGTERTLFVSKDGGRNWLDALVSLGFAGNVAITALLCVPQPGKPPLVIGGMVGGFLRSEDNGQSWQVIPCGSPEPVPTALAASQDGILYAGTADDGILVSHNGGRAWVRWNFGLLDWHIFSIVVLPAADGIQPILAGTESGIFRSVNKGRAWREVDFPLDLGAVLSLAAAPDGDGKIVFAGTETGDLLRSTDGGQSWEAIAPGVFDSEISVLAVSGGSLLAASHERLLVSHDLGGTWKDWNGSESISGSILSLVAPQGLDSGQPLVVGTNGNIYLIARE
jgi:photosystem II stability/assembly factor-like uncharacterized protein